ncbi:MAG: class I SAM-dependent methyltransferase [Planctomycetes bacterium]|nr:class I SAM-dependent methyltransferase [Planctomycetota bacterium]
MASDSNITVVERNLYRCSACTHMFTIFAGGKHENLEMYDMHAHWWGNPNVNLFQFIKTIVLKNSELEGLKLLDVGCGNGNFLDFLGKSSCKFTLTGIDRLVIPINRTFGKNTIKFVNDDFMSMDFVSDKFDVIVSLAVIEHVDDAHAFIKKIRDALTKDGLAIISTINNESLIYKLARLARFCGVYGPLERLYFHHHYHHFTNNSFKLLMEKNGFKLVKLKNHNYPFSATDIPFSNPILAGIYRLCLGAVFLISSVVGNEIHQTIVCKKQ